MTKIMAKEMKVLKGDLTNICKSNLGNGFIFKNLILFFETPKEIEINVGKILSPSMIKYAKKVVLRKFNFKNSFFSTFTFKKILKTYLNYILKS